LPSASSHPHSHHDLPTPHCPIPSVLLPSRPGGGTRADWLPAAQASNRWGAAGGRDCGNRGLLPERARLPRTPPAQPQ
jgi:hypothetical protein